MTRWKPFKTTFVFSRDCGGKGDLEGLERVGPIPRILAPLTRTHRHGNHPLMMNHENLTAQVPAVLSLPRYILSTPPAPLFLALSRYRRRWLLSLSRINPRPIKNNTHRGVLCFESLDMSQVEFY